ncbi:MAG: phospholipase D-like domain-containing protein [Promethearchaeota archaeon]
MTEIIIVSTGEKWVGYGIRSFSSIVEEMINDAEREIIMTIYIISDIKIIRNIKKALDRGISIEIYIYFPEIFPVSKAINEILDFKNEYRHLKIYKIPDKILHAKVLITDSFKVLIGSANLTLGGMIKNYELGVLIKNGRIAQKIITLLKRIM